MEIVVMVGCDLHDKNGLCEIACRENSILAFAARELYCGTEEKPEAPFLDNWSLQETFARDWLMRMAEAFG
ncbi:MAG TPA: hypothetical protein VGP72_27890 [Planctomycetota bacterium]|jgi:hypothetical protein